MNKIKIKYLLAAVTFTLLSTFTYAAIATPYDCNDFPGRVISSELSLNDCWVRDQAAWVDSIVQFANDNPEIDQLDLTNTNLHADVANKLVQLKYIKHLVLNRNHFGDKGVKIIASDIVITDLQLNDNQISDAGVAELVKNNNYFVLYLNDNRITDKGVAMLVQMQKLLSLELDDNIITDEGAVTLATDVNIDNLTLNQNFIGDKGALALAATAHLGDLELMYNNIGADGVNALQANRNILYLMLTGNPGYSGTSVQRNGSHGAVTLNNK